MGWNLGQGHWDSKVATLLGSSDSYPAEHQKRSPTISETSMLKNHQEKCKFARITEKISVSSSLYVLCGLVCVSK